MSEERELHRGDRIADTFPCIADEVEGKNGCGSSDGMSIYHHGATDDAEEYYDASCWVCKQGFSPYALANSSVGESFLSGDAREREFRKARPMKRITPRENKFIRDATLSFTEMRDASTPLYRGLKGEYLAFFAHRLEYKDGELFKVYYPETQDAKFMGYKPRHTQNKDFVSPIGFTGISSDLSGQSLFKGGGKYLAIVGGENDKVALFQGLRDYQIQRGHEGYDPIAVVSTTTGEGSAFRQCAENYDFINSFDNIYVGMDNDEAGLKAMEALLPVLPAEKVSIITWSMEDPHAMLEAGKEQQMVSNFFSAKPLIKSNISKSNESDEEAAIAELMIPRITLPLELHRLQAAMGGGIRQARMVNIVGTTSVGKTSHVNRMVYYWLFNSPIKVGIVSVELTKVQYDIDMMSMHLGVNLDRMPPLDAAEYLRRDDVRAKLKDLRENAYGEERYVILDDRDGGIASLEKNIDKMIKKHGCKLIVIDVLSDLTREASVADQEAHMMYQKRLLKEGITIINILHTAKIKPDNKGIVRKTNQYDALGSSSFIQSGAINIVLNRDLNSKDDIVRNTTTFDMPKCRGGDTGEEVSSLYYDVKTRETHDLQDWLEANGGPLPEEDVVEDPEEDKLDEGEGMFT